MGIDPGYVLDRMESYEVNALMKHSDRRTRSGWEQARLGAYVAAKCAGAKIHKMEELIEFPWESERHREMQAAAPEEERARIEAKMRWFEERGMI